MQPTPSRGCEKHVLLQAVVDKMICDGEMQMWQGEGGLQLQNQQFPAFPEGSNGTGHCGNSIGASSSM